MPYTSISEQTLALRASRELNKQQAERIKELEGDKEHPENYCHLCGGKNISWYADNELWNEVTKSETILGGICCPLCFVKMAEKKSIKPPTWRLSREGDAPREIELQLRVVNREERIGELEDGALQVVADSNKLQLEAAQRIKEFETEIREVSNQLSDLYELCSETTEPAVYGTILGLHERLERALKGR